MQSVLLDHVLKKCKFLDLVKSIQCSYVPGWFGLWKGTKFPFAAPPDGHHAGSFLGSFQKPLLPSWKMKALYNVIPLLSVSTNDLTCWVGNLWHQFVKGCTVVEVWVGGLKFNGICYKWVWLFWNLKDWWATKLYLVCSQFTCTARNILWPLSLYHCA